MAYGSNSGWIISSGKHINYNKSFLAVSTRCETCHSMKKHTLTSPYFRGQCVLNDIIYEVVAITTK